jgi:hypothetical protein
VRRSFVRISWTVRQTGSCGKSWQYITTAELIITVFYSRAVPSCHKLPSDDSLLKIRASVYAEKPKKDIYNFIGNFTRFYGDNKV